MIRSRAALVALLAGAALVSPPPAPAIAQTGGSAEEESVAGYESAGDLMRKCRENSSFSRSHCFAYLAAVADSARAYRIWIGSGDPCLPGRVPLGRLADIFEAYLIANPSQTKAQAASVIVASLQESFPCPVAPAQAAGSASFAVPPSDQGAGGEVDRRPQGNRQP